LAATRLPIEETMCAIALNPFGHHDQVDEKRAEWHSIAIKLSGMDVPSLHSLRIRPIYAAAHDNGEIFSPVH